MKPALDHGDVRIWLGDVIAGLREMPDGLAQTCVTSPPYWGLRDYGADGQIGLEDSPDAFVERLVEVFREVRRVLRDDGTLWLNLGDSYAAQGGGHGGRVDNQMGVGAKRAHLAGAGDQSARVAPNGLKPKDLVGIPWRVAFALQADGWYLRSDIIWHKPNAMPESVTDRPTKAHEYVFLLAKCDRYYYDADAIREKNVSTSGGPWSKKYRDEQRKAINGSESFGRRWNPDGKNARSVWTITTKSYSEAHFATFPTELPERCIKAGSREGDTVLDPFMGSGTTAWVARHLGRQAVGCELNAEYLDIAARRLQQQSLLA
jgi:DNA modification methylase